MSKKTSILLIIFLISAVALSTFSLASADYVSVSYSDTITGSDGAYAIKHVQPSDQVSYVSAVGQTFIAPNDFYLTAAVFSVYDQNYLGTGADLTIKAALYACSGTNPTGNPVAVSTTQYTGTQFTDDTNYNGHAVQWNFNGTYQLIKDTRYTIAIYCTVFSAGALNVVEDQTTPSFAAGTSFSYSNGAWVNGAQDLIFTVIGTTTATPTPTASPAPTQMSGNYWDNWANQTGNTNTAGYTWINTYLPFAVPIILVLAVGFLCYKYIGPWGFFAGLNLGVIVAYAIFPTYVPLWAVIVMVVVDALMLYGKIGYHRGE